ncbi:MAG TPA: hypothetical protein DD473_27495, partial [Planctomycetaceae bacterium]|nr:hypothetical protein [Planctomycetaceae bacterium]
WFAPQYYNTKRSHMERDHLPPIREEPDEVTTISIDQIEVRKYVGGLIKSFERKVARSREGPFVHDWI